MKILYVENNKEIINLIKKECDTANYEIVFVDNPIEALNILENFGNDIALIITEIDFFNLDYIKYLKEIRKFKKYIPIVITSNKDFTGSFLEFINISIKKILRKTFKLEDLKKVIFEINEEIKYIQSKNEQIIQLEQNQLTLQTVNEELNSTLKPFKEFSFYSQTDLNGIITEISDSFCELIGYKKSEIIGKNHSVVKHPFEDRKKYKKIWENLSSGKNWTGELRCKDKNGDDLWYKTIIFPKKDKNGKTIAYCAKRQDITDRKSVELLSITNDLTGLYNKRFFNKTFENELNRAKREEKNLFFIMIDIDYFKKYNDKYGHLKGDNVLKKVADVLKSMTKRVNDFAFRLGGEEFGIISTKLEEEKIIQYAQEIKKAIDKLKIIHEDSPFGYLSVSMGIYNLQIKDKKTSEQIYTLADKALYIAKDNGRNQIFYHTLNF